MDLSQGLETLLLVAAVAMLAPVLVALLPGPRIPQVVLLVFGGVLIGPQVLGIAESPSVALIADVGLGFLFLMAGYELDLTLFRQQPGRLAITSWLVSTALAVGVVSLLAWTGFVHAFVPVALALTTTALGVLLPILRDNDMLGGRLGRHILAAGAVGELFPVIAIAIFLGTNSQFVALASLASVGALAVLLTVLPKLIHGRRLRRIILEGEHATAQTTLRATIVLLLFLLVLANAFGLDVILGAFLAGMVLRRWAPGDVVSLEHKLDAIGYGFFIPVFFVSSGMNLNVRSIAEAPQRLVVFLLLLLAVRGVPALLVYRWALPAVERVELMFATAVSLPLLVALTEIGLRNGTMLPENAAALVGAGALSVLVFPMAVISIDRRRRARIAAPNGPPIAPTGSSPDGPPIAPSGSSPPAPPTATAPPPGPTAGAGAERPANRDRPADGAAH
jgi:Kef-type K+ transport system membrane component KefB